MIENRWIIDGHHYTCPECGNVMAIIENESDEDFDFCPFCGKRMSGQTEMEQAMAPSDAEFDFKRGYAQSKTDLSLQMIKELDELETPDERQHSSDWIKGYDAGVSRMTKIFIKLMRGVKIDNE